MSESTVAAGPGSQDQPGGIGNPWIPVPQVGRAAPERERHSAAPGYGPGYGAAAGYGPEPGYPAGDGHPGMPGGAARGAVSDRRHISGWAVATLVLGLTLWPLALITGPVALRQTRWRARRGRGLALVGLTFTALWVVLTAGVVVLRLAPVAHLNDQVLTVGTAGRLAGISVGECFDEGDSGLKVVPCEGLHSGELFFTGAVLGDGTVGYPGEDYLRQETRQLCDVAFAPYVGLDYPSSGYSYVAYVPDGDSWAAGDRAAACVIGGSGRPLTGAAAGAGS